MWTSAGLRATDLTATRSSPGPGFGVGRLRTSKGSPLAGVKAARWVVILDLLCRMRIYKCIRQRVLREDKLGLS